jgi:4-hydroxyphenylacetate 3-monooxygenase
VTDDPRLARGARTIAGLYDLQLRPELVDEMTYVSPTSGERVGLSFIEPRSREDLIRRRKMFSRWAEYGCGMLGRTPDYLNTILMGCAGNRAYFDQAGSEFGDRIVAYYEMVRERDLVMTHAFVTPQRDRGVDQGFGPKGEVPLDTSVNIVDTNANGIVLRGARILATLAPYSDELLILPSPSRSYLGDFSPAALAVAVPVAWPGLRFICRESFDLGRSSFDHPLASRFEEQDAVVVFDEVELPWERVFIYGNARLCSGLFKDTTAYAHGIHQFLAKNLAKAEFVLGVSTLIAQTIKTDQHLHVQTMLGEMVDAVETIRAYIRTAEVDAEPDATGICVPRVETLWTARSYFPKMYPRMVELLQLIGSSGLMAIPDQATIDSEIADDVELYYQSATLGGRERVRLFRVAWEVACSAFGGRQVLYERFFAGDPYRNLSSRYLNHDKTRAIAMVQGLLEREGVAVGSGGE